MADEDAPASVLPAAPQASAAPASASAAALDSPQPAQPTMNLLAPKGEALVASGGPPPANHVEGSPKTNGGRTARRSSR